jgi:hypothetical protein
MATSNKKITSQLFYTWQQEITKKGNHILLNDKPEIAQQKAKQNQAVFLQIYSAYIQHLGN